MQACSTSVHTNKTLQLQGNADPGQTVQQNPKSAKKLEVYLYWSWPVAVVVLISSVALHNFGV